MNVVSFNKLLEESFSQEIMFEGDEVHLYGFGEPTLNAGLGNMIKSLKDKKVHTKINTNGLWKDSKTWDSISQAGLEKCLISVDGLDRETYNQYRVGGDFELLMRNIRYACSNSRGTEIELQFIVFPHNLSQKERFESFCREINAHTAVIKRPRDWTGAERRLSDLGELPLEYKRKNNMGVCRFIEDFGMVLYDGTLTICSADAFGRYAVGNIFSEGPNLWRSERFKELKRKSKEGGVKICTSCGYGEAYLEKVKLK